MPNPIKELLLGRGWAGTTITRAETVERLNPIVKQHIYLNRSYRYVIRTHGDESVTAQLETLQKTARGDVGKLSETILSCGGSAYNGTDLTDDDFDLGDDPAGMLFELSDLEEDFLDTVQEERAEIEHQMRSRAILEVVIANSEDRLQTLRKLTRGLSRPAA